jgi:hypothetical protein
MEKLARIKKNLLAKKELIEENQQHEIKRLFENFKYQFTWEAEHMYKNASRISLINDMIELIDNDHNLTVDRFKEYFLNRVIYDTRLMDRSTGQIHSLVSLWDKECTLDMLRSLGLI